MAILEPGAVDHTLDEADLEFGTYRGGGPGGQHRNTSDTGVRIRHIPTGTVVKVDRGRSWYQNRQAALAEMERRLGEAAAGEAASAENAARVAQIGVGDRASHDWTWCAWRNTVTHNGSGRTLAFDRAMKGRIDW